MSVFLTWFWRGDIRLVVAFWGFGVGFPWALDVAVQFLPHKHLLWLLPPLGFLAIPINLFIAVGVFCSGHTPPPPGPGRENVSRLHRYGFGGLFGPQNRRRRGLHLFHFAGVSVTVPARLTPLPVRHAGYRAGR